MAGPVDDGSGLYYDRITSQLQARRFLSFSECTLMYIRVGYDITFDLARPTTFLTLLRVHPSEEYRLVSPETPSVEPNCWRSEHIDAFGNRAMRVSAPEGKLRLRNDAVVVDSGTPDIIAPHAQQNLVEDLPPEVIPFLLPSRYCEVDRLGDIAWDLFGSAPLGWGRVQAVCDWVHNHVQFGYEHARSTKTAYDTYTEAKGVCRDFTHLALTFCRCLNIPARYATGYLGDIGVPASPCPMDFSAWFEVYLDSRWYTFDARHNIPRIGRIVMARGRDAVDAALTTSFGPSTLEQFLVWTDEVDGPGSTEK